MCVDEWGGLAGVIRIAGESAGLLGSWEMEDRKEACQVDRMEPWEP